MAVVVAVLLSLMTVARSQSPTNCTLERIALQSSPGGSQGQDVYVGLILPVHHYNSESNTTCGILGERDILHIEAFFWAISTYNSRHADNTSQTSNLRGVAFDTCGSSQQFERRLKQWNSCTPKRNTLAFLGYDNGAVTNRAAVLFDQAEDVFINISPHSPYLTRETFSYYYQLSPSVDQEAQAIVGFLNNQAWRQIYAVYVDDEYGRSALTRFSIRAQKSNINVIQNHSIPLGADGASIQLALQPLQNSRDGSPTVVVFGYDRQKAKVYDVLENGFIVVSTGNVEDYRRPVPSKSTGIVLTFTPNGLDNNWVKQFKADLSQMTYDRKGDPDANPWFKNYFEEILDCGESQSQPCGTLKLENAEKPIPNSTVLMKPAVDIVTRALQNATKVRPASTELLKGRFQEALSRDWGKHGGLPSDSNNPGAWEYKVFRLNNADGYTQIGSIKWTEKGMEIYSTSMQNRYLGKETRWDFGYGWIIAIGVLAGLGIILVIVTALIIVVLYRRAVRISYIALYAILLFGAFIGYLTLFAFIPVPTTATCGITRFGIGLSYAICLAVMVVISLIMFKKLDSSFVPRIFIYCVLFLLVAIEVVILVMWFILVPPGEGVHKPGYEPTWGCSHYTRTTTVLRTDFENHLLALIYVMVLILLLLVLGVLLFTKRKKMIDRLTKIQAALILVAGIGCALIWIAWALVGGLLKWNIFAQEFADGAMAFGLWLILTLLVLLFLIQLYFHWKNSNGKLNNHTTTLRNSMPGIMTIENRHVIDDRRDENIITTTTTTTTNTTPAAGNERTIPITIVDNKQGQHIEMNRVEDLRNHSSRANGNLLVTKQTKKETHSHSESHAHPRDPQRYTAHVSQAKLSGASDHLSHHHHQHHHHDHHNSSGHHSTKSFFCSECGFIIDPNALHLKHPRSERSSTHNTSVLVADASGHLVNGDTSFAHSDVSPHPVQEHHPIYTRSPYGVYSTPTIYYSNRRPESIYSTNQRVMRISREGRMPSRVGMSFSEYDRIGYPKRSFRRTKSEEQLGAL